MEQGNGAISFRGIDNFIFVTCFPIGTYSVKANFLSVTIPIPENYELDTIQFECTIVGRYLLGIPNSLKLWF